MAKAKVKEADAAATGKMGQAKAVEIREKLMAEAQGLDRPLLQQYGAYLGGLVRGDLDWIAMMCLEKDRQRRYETATLTIAPLQKET